MGKRSLVFLRSWYTAPTALGISGVMRVFYMLMRWPGAPDSFRIVAGHQEDQGMIRWLGLTGRGGERGWRVS